MAVSKELLKLLACPRDKLPLMETSGFLYCSSGHKYPVVNGIPVLLIEELPQTHIAGERALAIAHGHNAAPPQFDLKENETDPFVSEVIAATNGILYQHLVGKLKAYPIPYLNLPAGQGKLFLEIGCNWGRWCIAAARLGYTVYGVDPSLLAVQAAQRVAKQLGVTAHYAVADGRALPFSNFTFDEVFSYSVLQHLSKENAGLVLSEVRAALKKGGHSLIQMPNGFGIRCLYHQIRRGFRQTRDFEVRYWTPWELRSVFEQRIGPSRFFVDGYFSLNPQISDLRFLPRRYRFIVRMSDALSKASTMVRPLQYVADSIYLSANRAS